NKLEMKRKSRITKLKRLWKVGAARRVESSEDKYSLGDQEDPSKQGRNIADIDQDVNVTLIDETQGKLNDEDMFGINDLHSEEVIVEDTTGPTIPITTAESKTIKAVTTTTTLVTTAATLVTTAAVTRPKAKGIVFHDQKEQVSMSKPTVSSTQSSIKDKAEISEEERIRRQMEEEANIALIES
ncbi:hypothetical protein Tco_0029758, partial [Tanacetum coccineum]